VPLAVGGNIFSDARQTQPVVRAAISDVVRDAHDHRSVTFADQLAFYSSFLAERGYLCQSADT